MHTLEATSSVNSLHPNRASYIPREGSGDVEVIVDYNDDQTYKVMSAHDARVHATKFRRDWAGVWSDSPKFPRGATRDASTGWYAMPR